MNTGRATRSEIAGAFRAPHVKKGGFVIPNPRDAGTTRLLDRCGFRALAAHSTGQRGDGVSRALGKSVGVPVSTDLEDGFGVGVAPGVVLQTILLAAEAGMVGGSIEESTGQAADPLRAMAFAAERLRAAVAAAARSLPLGFTPTARGGDFHAMFAR